MLFWGGVYFPNTEANDAVLGGVYCPDNVRPMVAVLHPRFTRQPRSSSVPLAMPWSANSNYLLTTLHNDRASQKCLVCGHVIGRKYRKPPKWSPSSYDVSQITIKLRK